MFAAPDLGAAMTGPRAGRLEWGRFKKRFSGRGFDVATPGWIVQVRVIAGKSPPEQWPSSISLGAATDALGVPASESLTQCRQV
jgi:hypothetical protein